MCCAPFGRVCERLEKTPLWDDVDAAYDETKERIQVREYAVEKSLRELKRCLLTGTCHAADCDGTRDKLQACRVRITLRQVMKLSKSVRPIIAYSCSFGAVPLQM